MAYRCVSATIIPFNTGSIKETQLTICKQRGAFPQLQTWWGNCHAFAVTGKYTVGRSLMISYLCLWMWERRSYRFPFPLQAGDRQQLFVQDQPKTMKSFMQMKQSRKTNINSAPWKSQHRRHTCADAPTYTHKECCLLCSASIKWFKLCTAVNF